MSTSYALIFEASVVKIANAINDVAPPLQWVDISSVTPAPQYGWNFDGANFTAPAAPALTKSQVVAQLLNSGVTITSNSISTLHGLFACDTTTQGQISSVGVSIALKGVFPNGSNSGYQYPTLTGGSVVFANTAVFVEFAAGVSAYVNGLMQYANGFANSAPSSSVTIP
jgi:hypothetical protein